jgi:hypothetical protein
MRINGDYQELLVELCEGNIGALTGLIAVCHKSRYAPAILAWLKHNDIRGEKFYLLWNDICKRELMEFEKIYFQYMQDELSIEEIQDMIEKAR